MFKRKEIYPGRSWADLPARIIPIAILVLIPFAGKLALWLPITPEPVDLGADLVGLMLPWMQSGIDAWSEGELPLWTHLEGIGRPLISNLQSAAFYPQTWLLALASGGRLDLTWMELYTLWHLAIAGLGTFWLARVLGMGRGAALLAGAIYSSAGFFLHHLPALSLVASAAWVPWGLAAAFKGLASGGWRWSVAAAIFLALTILGGMPQPAFYLALFIVLLGVYFASHSRSPWPLLKVATIGALSFALAAVVLLPGMRELPDLFRGGEWRQIVQPHPELLPARIISFFAPQIGNVQPLPVAFVLFFGTASLILAVLGIRERRLSHRPVLVIGLILFLVMALAEELAIDGFFAGFLPGYGLFKDHNRAGLMVNILGAILAGAGVQRLRSPGDRTDRRLAIVSIVFVLAVQAGVIGFGVDGWGDWRFLLYSFMAVAAALLLGGIVFLAKRAPRAAMLSAALVCVTQLLVITNTNNLRRGIRDTLDKFNAQAEAIPRGAVPPRVRREYHYFWTNLDAYNGLNAFRSEDANQYIALKELWHAAEKRPRLGRQFGTRYWITGREPPQERRSTAALKLDGNNRLQFFNLSGVGATKFLRIRISGVPDRLDRVSVSAAARLADGTVVEIPTEKISDQAGDDGSVFRFKGSIRLRKRKQVEGVWAELVEGDSARVTSIVVSSGRLWLPPWARRLAENVYEWRDALPRAFLQPRVRHCKSPGQMLQLMQENVDLEERVLLLDGDAPRRVTRPWSAVESARARAEFVHYSRHRVRLSVDAPREAYLVLSDLYHAGWSAEVDGKPAKILRANFCARAVKVPTGKHVVEFRYSDPLAIVGIAVSLTALALSIAVIAWPRKRR